MNTAEQQGKRLEKPQNWSSMFCNTPDRCKTWLNETSTLVMNTGNVCPTDQVFVHSVALSSSDKHRGCRGCRGLFFVWSGFYSLGHEHVLRKWISQDQCMMFWGFIDLRNLLWDCRLDICSCNHGQWKSTCITIWRLWKLELNRTGSGSKINNMLHCIWTRE